MDAAAPDMTPCSTGRPGRQILLFVQSNIGGIAEHAHYQAQELARRGWVVTMLCKPGYLARTHAPLYDKHAVLADPGGGASIAGKLLRKAASVWNYYVLFWWILRLRGRLVLFDATAEYSAPFWVWPHILLSWLGVRYLANFHDPVRSRHFGPEWLHRLSVTLMYQVFSGGLIHGPIPPEAGIPPHYVVLEAPLGYFDDVRDQPVSRDIRADCAIPAEAWLLLSFGHVVDRKNLDLLIRALVDHPDVHLLVAGPWSPSTQRGPDHYSAVAEAAGVAQRLHLAIGFVPDADIPAYFTACDAVALTYRGDFVSQSGVLQHAAAFRKPILVSCGPGPLRDTMLKFPLGVLVEPDSIDAIAAGLSTLRAMPAISDATYASYDASASWRTNIDRLEDVMRQISSKSNNTLSTR